MTVRKALLIIDMQKGSFTAKTPRYATKRVVSNINQIAKKFRALGHSVIFVQHDGTSHNVFIKHSHEWEKLDDLETDKTDRFVDKYANDIFYQSNLDSLLQKKEITDLYVTGCATDFCVESAIQSALAKDYNVTVVGDAHTTGNRPHLLAEQVIEHYNWVWSNMIPTKGKVEVRTTLEITEEL